MSKTTLIGAFPDTGIAFTVTAGGAVAAAPWPTNSNWLTLISEPLAPGLRNTRNSSWVPAVAGIGSSTVL